MIIRPTSYQVLITPLVAKNTYGYTVDVSKDIDINDYVLSNGLNTIKREIDNGDFDIGVYVFNSINLTCLNINGVFSDQSDYRTLFKYGRDKAKVDIYFYDGSTNTPTVTFQGIIDDRATKIDFKKNQVKMTVLSKDSILNRTKVSGGTVTSGIMISQAIKSILNVNEVTAVLNYDPANINVLNDYLVDVGSYFDNKTIKEALDELLSVSNSILYINDSNDIIVKSRDHRAANAFELFGDGDQFGRENIIDIKNYNTGMHRSFNTVKVGTQSASDLGMIDAFGDNVLELDFEFITNANTQAEIAADILDYWKVPKIELEVKVKTKLVKHLRFFDLVSLNVPYRTVPAKGTKLPTYGSAKYGEGKYPAVFGNIKIRPNVAFKIVGIYEDPVTYLTTLKLRQTGKDINDGYFATIGSFYGTAIYGENLYQIDAERVDPNTKSAYGAAKYGTVHYGNV